MERALSEDVARLALDAGQLGTWWWDRRTGAVDWDRALEAMWGYPPGGFPGSFDAYVERVHPDDRHALLADIEEALATGGSYDVHHRVRWPDGTVRWIEGRGKAVLDGGGAVVGTVGCVRDVTDRAVADAERTALLERAARLVDRLERLQAITAELGRAVSSADVADVAVRAVVPQWAAGGRGIWLLDDTMETVVLVNGAGYEDDFLAGFGRIPLERDVPIALAARTRQPILIGSRAERDARWPALAGVSTGSEAVAVIPLLVESRCLGTLVVGYVEPRAFSPDDVEFLQAVAGQFAQALDRARMIEAERAARAHLAFLAEATAIVTSYLSVDDVIERLAALPVPSLADWTSVYVAEHDVLRRRTVVHGEPSRADSARRLQGQVVRLDSAHPIAAVFTEQRPRLFVRATNREVEAVSGGDEAIAELVRSLGASSVMAVPLVARGEAVGAMSFVAAEGRAAYTAEHLALAVELAARAAVAIDNARLYEAGQAALRHTRLLLEATAAIAVATATRDVGDVILTHAHASLGTRAGAVVVVDASSGDGVPVTVAGDDGPASVLWRRIPAGTAHPVNDVVASGREVLVGAPAQHATRWPGVDVGDGDRAWAYLPLRTPTAVAGVIVLTWAEDRRFDVLGERLLMSAIAAQGGQALERARLYEAEHEVADALQRGLLPPALPTIPGVELAARYVPAGGLMIGGDFYDVFRLRSGGWALMLGDVCGTGPRAAALTAQVRYTARATARAGDVLGDVAAAVNETLLEGGDDERFCTAALAAIRPGDDGSVRLDVVSAGHPTPLVVRADGRTEELECRGTLLGVTPTVSHDPFAVHLDPGDACVFITDGVLEARAPGRGQFFGGERLAAAAAAARGSAAGIATAVADAVREHSGGALGDDVAVVVLQARPA